MTPRPALPTFTMLLVTACMAATDTVESAVRTFYQFMAPLHGWKVDEDRLAIAILAVSCELVHPGSRSLVRIPPAGVTTAEVVEYLRMGPLVDAMRWRMKDQQERRARA